MMEPLEDRWLLAFVPPADPRIVANLDAGWKFLRANATNAQTAAFNDSSRSDVSVPHTWNTSTATTAAFTTAAASAGSESTSRPRPATGLVQLPAKTSNCA